MAASLATALGELNGRGYVVGDINESNACITENQQVTLIDADSIQVRDHEVAPPRVYNCPVGKPEYTPPELQGVSFDEVERTIYHDRFALAVIIYQLLMEGAHPFSGKYTAGGEPPQREDSISGGFFLYSESRGVPLGPLDRDHILWEAPDERLRNLFVRCFDEGHSDPDIRPSPREWANALEETARSLTVCDSNPNHLYSTRQAIVPACPWCERKALTGLDSFPPPQTPHVQSKSPSEPDPADTQPSPQTATQPQARGPQPSPATPPATGFRFPARLATVAALALAVLAIGLCAVYSGESGSGVAPDGTQGQVPPPPPASGGAASFETPVGTPVPVAVLTPKAPNTPIAAAIVPTITPIPTGTSTLTPRPSDTPTPRPTFTHSPTVTPTPTASPTASHTPLPTSISHVNADSAPDSYQHGDSTTYANPATLHCFPAGIGPEKMRPVRQRPARAGSRRGGSQLCSSDQCRHDQGRPDGGKAD